jgi:hypothetical protein
MFTEIKTMKKIMLLFVTFTVIAFLGLQTASAQLPIKVPKIPKPKPQPTQTTTAQPTTNTEQPTQPSQPESRNETKPATAAAGDDQPTIAKDSVRVQAHSISVVWINGRRQEGSSWLPEIEYRVNGPVPSGGHFSVEFSLPNNKQWLKLDCAEPTIQVGKGYWWKTACGWTTSIGGIREEQAVTYTGPVKFAIHLNNPLQGTDTVLFAGEMKVGKYVKSPQSPSGIEYYVDEDWRIPIGYIGFEFGPPRHETWTTARSNQDESPTLLAAMEFRGNPGPGGAKAYLFYQGKELVHTLNGVGETSRDQYYWRELEFSFRGVYRNEPPPGTEEDPRHNLSKNPGEYEIKIISGGRLARSLKFTVGRDGSFDNGIATTNRLGSSRVIVPIQVIGDEGPWNRMAWKTDAFYGNPLTGLSVP